MRFPLPETSKRPEKWSLPFLLMLLLGACVSQTITSTSVPSVKTLDEDVPEELLLDVGIVIFDPGLELLEEDEKLPTYPEVRKAEARYMPYLLLESIQSSAAWGAVRVVPDENQAADL